MPRAAEADPGLLSIRLENVARPREQSWPSSLDTIDHSRDLLFSVLENGSHCAGLGPEASMRIRAPS